ncbi:tetratricopeptide repeat-containing sulfotransferase family protein [Tabrizicola sp. TH137]|uniref:tetratricopeptide repeat-containing sulfotransferase family protein n=1 Tax=Tabrizicola sp. TH137 TaxID=2067452 RepID=UPI0013044CE1|nr:tetratricopeptide repeat-containing sulfotransferase family protein [Tabrizicola sp. TH137]
MTTAPLSAAEIKSLYADGMAKLAAGQPDAALPLFGRIIDANPGLAEPLWQAARIFGDFDMFDRALDHAAAAARLKPAEPVVWATWADLVALSGQVAAEKVFLEAVKTSQLPPALRIRLQDRFGAQRRASRPDTTGLPAPVLAQASRQIAEGAFGPAQKAVAALLAKHPKHAVLHNMMGSLLSGMGQGGPAIAALRMAQKIDPFYAEAWLNEANEWRRQEKVEEAQRAYRAAIARAPDLEQALVRYAALLNQQMLALRALPFAERAVAAHPKSVPALVALGNTLTLLREHDRAVTVLERAAALSNRQSTEALVLLAQVYTHVNRDAEAAVLIDRVLELRPDHVIALTRKASLLQTAGDFAAADEAFRRALALAPTDGDLFRSFILGYKVRPGDPIVGQMQAAMALPDLPDRSRLSFAFALGKALEDQKDHVAAFPYIRQGNDLVRKLFPFDMASRRAEVAAVQEAMRGFDWAGTRIDGASTGAPIFVTGMPRSGTTLVEQIIASHSRVTGAGEVALLQSACQKLIFARPDRYDEMRRLRDIPAPEIAALGHDFLRVMADRFPGADIITDKSITTYMYIGLVKLALPEARIMVVRRDPRDTLLSIYKNRFPEGTHLYAYDLRDLAEHYATFVEMVEFWRTETPDWFTEITYETLVADPETESRRLIAACGLDWQDACLNFHENKRKVDTLSVYQVRQPISGGSVKAWQRYEAELAPMIDVLRARGLLPD